jgi:putative exporter of polyketide antibiotics
LAVIASLAVGKVWLQTRRAIIIWSVITFLCLAKFTYFGGKYLEYLDNWQATREATSLVTGQGSVYTTAQITPHLSSRALIKYTNTD